MDATGIVAPPADGDLAPLQQQGRMMVLLLGQCANLVDEGQGLGKVREAVGPLDRKSVV